MNNRFTKKANEVLSASKKSAKELGSLYIGTEHLLLGILSTDCVGAKILKEKGVTREASMKIMQEAIQPERKGGSLEELTPRAKRVLEGASALAKRFSGQFIGSEHILFSICNEADSYGARLLISLEINLQVIKSEISSFLDIFSAEEKKEKQPNSSSALAQYGRNLNKLASTKIFDPLLKRESELSRLMQILTRRTKNNPC